MMERPATWKVITVGVALTGLGIVGAGTVSAATSWAPEVSIVAMDDDWTETYWDDGWDGQRWSADWTETYWDD